MPEVPSDEIKKWPGIPSKNRTEGRDLPQFHRTRHDAQQRLLKGESVQADSGTRMTELEIAEILTKLSTPEARERFLGSLIL